MLYVFPVITGKLGILERRIEGAAAAYQLPLYSRHMPGVPGEVLSRVLALKYRGGMIEDPSPNIHIKELVRPFCKCLVTGLGGVCTPPEIHPVPALDDRDRLVRGYQFAFVLLVNIHNPFPFLCCLSYIVAFRQKPVRSEVKDAVLYLLSPSLVPELRPDIAAGPPCHRHL